MGNGKHGLGIVSSSRVLITPCPSMVEYFFKDQLKYSKADIEHKHNTNQFLVRFTKALNHPDQPVFPDLNHISCVSNIVIDLYSGAVIDHYFKINRGSAIRTFSECPDIESMLYIFKWHLNIVHMAREYLKGGWMQRGKIQKEIESMKDKYVILNKKGFTNILEKAKPDFVKYVGKGKLE